MSKLNDVIDKMKVLKVLVSNEKVNHYKEKINSIWMRVARNIPITIDFDQENILWFWDCKIEEDKIFAYIPVTQDFIDQILSNKQDEIWNLYPCMWIEMSARSVNEKWVTVIQDFNVLEVSFCTASNINLFIKNLRTQFESWDACILD